MTITAFPIPVAMPTTFVGIDVSKTSHYAGFVSAALLRQYRRFEKCPTLKFGNSRAEFERLVVAMKTHDHLANIAVILEMTGHYHRPLLDYLQEQEIQCYILHAQERPTETKTDKTDALGLANLLFSQVGLGVQSADKSAVARPYSGAASTALVLRHLVRHRYELVAETTRRKNKLVALSDQLFPEFVEIFVDPNKGTALAVRETFPTALAVASADLAALKACRTWSRPSDRALIQLQELAAKSIGCKDAARLRGLLFEQQQLIAELRMLTEHLDALEAEITAVLADSREGQILMSFDSIKEIHAAEILSAIGNVANFETKGHLRKYFGWSPKKEQTGTSTNNNKKSRSGRRHMKSVLWLIASSAVSHDTEWRRLYERLLPRLCRYDADREEYIGRNRVIARVAGQITGLIWTLLRQDYDVMRALAPGAAPPEPTLYDRAKHRSALNKQC